MDKCEEHRRRRIEKMKEGDKQRKRIKKEKEGEIEKKKKDGEGMRR
jgi:hypothetical protein